jgi:D-alanine transfer protein
VTHDRPRPLGLLACFLAVLVFVGAALAFERYAFDRARSVVRPYAMYRDSSKWLLLGLERAALADPRAMLMFGRSEFWYTGPIATPAQFFEDEPTGFWVFETGFGGTDSLFFLETVAALGNDLRGRKVAISISSTSFDEPADTRETRYAGNFSPRIINTLAFASSISPGELRYVARRALDHPVTLHDQGLARVALIDLADDTPLHRLSYALIYPLGQIQQRFADLNEARQNLAYANAVPPVPQPAAFPPQSLDWRALLMAATDKLVRAAGDDPFGASPDLYLTGLGGGDALTAARKRYDLGLNNRDGQLAPPPPSYLPTIENSVERGDLEHELAVLRELGAIPFVINRPDDGLVLDYSDAPTSARETRQQYLDFIVAELERQGVTYVSFNSHDEDRFFILPASDHFTPRGWIFANRAIDLFWHGATTAQIASAIAEIDEWSPAPPPPAPTVISPAVRPPAE